MTQRSMKTDVEEALRVVVETEFEKYSFLIVYHSNIGLFLP